MAVPPALWWRAGNATVFNFSAPAVGGSLSASSCSTVAGACSVTLTATVAGSYAITASTGGSALGGSNPVSAVFVAGSPTAGGSRVTLSAGPKTANGTDAYTITASAYDSQGNLNTGSATVFNFTAPGVGASLSASSCSTTAGVCSVTLSATVAGSYAVTASTGGVPVGGSNPVTGVFVAGLPAAANSRVAISTGPKLANGVDSYAITATAYDAQGNLSSFNGTTFSFSVPGAGAALSAAECVTALTGPTSGTCSVMLTATVAGSYAVSADLAGEVLGGTNPVTGVFVAGTATAGSSRVVISAGPKTANGTDAYTITASAYDSQGNLNTGSATVFNFTAPGVGASLSASSCSTTAGVCSVTLSATVAGSYAVTASTGGVPVGGSNPVTGVFVAGLPAAANSRVAISTGPKLANGVDSYAITATAYDAQGNLSSFNGTTFSFSVPGAGAALSAAECVTALTGPTSGTCSVMLTATVAGSYAVSADLAGEVLGGTNPVTGVFVAGTATAGSSRVVISAGPKTANGTDAYTITASAYDSQGNLNTGSATVFNFTAPGVGASLSASSCSTTAGVCSVTLSATVAGSYAVTASTGGVPVGGSNPVTGVFVAGLPAAANSRVAISTGPKLANGVDSYTITASAYDAQGNLSSFNGTTFSFSVPGAGAALSAAECVTALTGPTSGTCSVMLTATVAGSYAVSADLAGEVLGGTNPVTGVFVAGTATAGSSRVVISAGPKTANGTDAYTITASAYDSQGNLNTGSATVFNFTAPGVGVSLSASSCSTTAGVCSVTLSATVAGSYAVTASTGGVPVGGSNPVTGVFVAGLPAAANSRVAISTGPKLANGVDSYTITASAYDAQGNLSSFNGTTFSFSVPGAGAALSAAECVTALTGSAAGTCSVMLTATVAGSYAVSADLAGEVLGGTNPVTGVFVAGTATAGSSRVVISAGPKTANGTDAYTITASAYDSQGNLNTGSATVFNFTAPGVGASLSASSCSTTAGVCSVTLSATVAGSYAVTASTGGVPVGGSNPVTGVFVAGLPAAANSRVAISTGPKLANGVDAYTLTASALDAQGNLNTSSAISFSFSDPGAGARLSASTCTTALSGANAGTCSVTLTATTAGS